MDLYYNLTRQCRVDATNCVISGRPVLYFGSRPELVLHFYTGEPGSDPVAADLSGIVAWRAAVDADWSHATDPMCRTLPEDIDAASAAAGVIKLPLTTCTARFAEVIGNRQSLEAFFELRGFDASGAAAAVIIFNVSCHNAVDADGGAALDEIPVDVAQKSWVLAKLSNVAAAASVTAFEVYAHADDIAAGTVDDVTGIAYAQAVPGSLTHKFILRSEFDDVDSDVVVDWGDGTVSEISAQEYERRITADGEYDFTVSHTYAADGRYVVRVLGQKYFGINHNLTTNSQYTEVEARTYNRLRRCLAADLPLASCVTNLASFAAYSRCLLVVAVPSSVSLVNIRNAAKILANCANLTRVSGLGRRLASVQSVDDAFINDSALTFCDLVLPGGVSSSNGLKRAYRDCVRLAVDIATILPQTFNAVTTLSADHLFTYCGQLTGTVPAALFWDNPDVIWTSTADAFTGCAAAIRAQVPASWGGTASNGIITGGTVNAHLSAIDNALGGCMLVPDVVNDTTATSAYIPLLSGGTVYRYALPLAALAIGSAADTPIEDVIIFSAGTAAAPPASVTVAFRSDGYDYDSGIFSSGNKSLKLTSLGNGAYAFAPDDYLWADFYGYWTIDSHGTCRLSGGSFTAQVNDDTVTVSAVDVGVTAIVTSESWTEEDGIIDLEVYSSSYILSGGLASSTDGGETWSYDPTAALTFFSEDMDSNTFVVSSGGVTSAEAEPITTDCAVTIPAGLELVGSSALDVRAGKKYEMNVANGALVTVVRKAQEADE